MNDLHHVNQLIVTLLTMGDYTMLCHLTSNAYYTLLTLLVLLDYGPLDLDA